MNRELERFHAEFNQKRHDTKKDSINKNYLGYVKMVDKSFNNVEQKLLSEHFSVNKKTLIECAASADLLLTIFNCTGVTPDTDKQAVLDKYKCYYDKQVLVNDGKNATEISDALPDCIFS